MMAAVGLLALVALVLLASALANNRVPLRDPPGPLVRLLTYLSRNSVQTSDDAVFAERRTITLAIDPSTAGERLRSVVESLGWLVTRSEPGRIDAVVRSALFGFRDDVVLRFEAISQERVRLHVSASSRVGRGDLGANTRHLLDLRDAFSDAGWLQR